MWIKMMYSVTEENIYMEGGDQTGTIACKLHRKHGLVVKSDFPLASGALTSTIHRF